MSTTQEKTPAPPADAEATVAEVGSIDKIRELLFGAQIRDLDNKLAHLTQRLAEESARLRSELDQKLESLQAQVSAELGALSSRLDAERSERAAGLKETVSELKATAKSLEVAIAQLADDAAKKQSDLRDEILDRSKSLTEDIGRKHEVVVSTMDDRVRELRDEKADRAALADLFSEISLRLKGSPGSGAPAGGKGSG